MASELLAYYPRTELDSLLTATLTQYWTSGRVSTEIDAIAGAGFLTQVLADLQYFAGQRQRELRAHQRDASPNQGPPAPGAWRPPPSLRTRWPATASSTSWSSSRRTSSAACSSAVPHLGSHPGQRQRHRGPLEQGPERRPLPAGGDLQLPRQHGHVHRRPGHRPGEQLGGGAHRRPHRQLAHSHELVQTPLLQSAAADLQIRNGTDDLQVLSSLRSLWCLTAARGCGAQRRGLEPNIGNNGS